MSFELKPIKQLPKTKRERDSICTKSLFAKKEKRETDTFIIRDIQCRRLFLRLLPLLRCFVPLLL